MGQTQRNNMEEIWSDQFSGDHFFGHDLLRTLKGVCRTHSSDAEIYFGIKQILGLS